jgi:RNA-directed DNA polymerase
MKLKDYFNKRDVKAFDRHNVAYRQKLARKQQYKCPLCKQSIADFKEGLETHHKIPKAQGGKSEYSNLQLVHSSCLTRHHRISPLTEDNE